MEVKPYVQTYTIIIGSKACNAQCPYCVSRMTPTAGVGMKPQDINWRNFYKGADLANQWGATTVLITGKGEPTLFPHQITECLINLEKCHFPLIELQTNGIKLAQDNYDDYLREWYKLGLTTIAISITHYESDKNAEIIKPYLESERVNLPNLISKLHKI